MEVKGTSDVDIAWGNIKSDILVVDKEDSFKGWIW